MAEPTSALSMQDLVLLVAEYYGVASYDSDGMPYIPADDKFNLRESVRIVNEAVRMFAARPPRRSGKWRWMHRTQTVLFAPSVSGTATDGDATSLTDSGLAATYDDDAFNTYTLWITSGTGEGEYAVVTDYDGTLGVFTFAALSGGSTPDTTSGYRISRSLNVINGDPARYMLSTDFGGQIAGPVQYIAESGHGTPIRWCDISEIVAGRETDVSTGYPQRAAIRPYTPTGPSLGARRWEIIVDPAPSSAKSIQFPYIVGFDRLRMEGGTATGGSATTLTDTGRTEPDDYFNGWTVTVVSGTGAGSYGTVTDFVKSTGVITVADWLDIEGAAGGTDPATSSIYILEPASNLHPAGFQFDEVIRSACMAKCEMEADDSELGAKAIQYFEKVSLPNAYIIDANAAPRTLGKMSSGSQGWTRTRENVTFTE